MKLYPKTFGDYLSLATTIMRSFLLFMVLAHASVTLWLGRNTWFADSPNARVLTGFYVFFVIGLTVEAFVHKHLTHSKRYNTNFFLAIFTFLYLAMFIAREIA